MKKLFTFILGMGAMLCANAQNPFAYGLTSGTPVSPNKGLITVDVTYSLNADADEVKALIMNENGEVVKTLALEGITKGEYETTLDLSGIGMGEFTWAIEVKGGATSGDPANFKTWSFYHPCGLDVDNSTESPSFGTIFVAEGYTNGETSGYVSAQADGTDGGGLYIFDAMGNSIENPAKGGYRFFGKGLEQSRLLLDGNTNGADFGKVAVADDGRIFVTRYNLLGDYILSAPSLAELIEAGEFTTSLVAGMTMTNNIYNDADGNYLVGPVQSFDVKGSGENTKLLAITRASNALSAGTSLNRVIEYNIGTDDILSAGTPNTAFDKKYTISYDKSANVAYDSRGGIWYCQYRGTPSNAEPALVYVDANGALQYFEGKGGKVRRRGAIAVSPDAMRLVANSAAGSLTVYDITYAADGAVTLSEVSTVSPGGTNMYAATWDCAGNFYCGNASSEYVKGYAVPRANNVFATKAPSKYSLVIDSTVSIDGIDTDADAPVEYYNLQGVKVENPEKGIFIKRQGSKTTKVVL